MQNRRWTARKPEARQLRLKRMKAVDARTRHSIALWEERFEKKRWKPYPKELYELRAETPVDKRKKKRFRRNLSLTEKIMACHMIICRELKLKDVARELSMWYLGKIAFEDMQSLEDNPG